MAFYEGCSDLDLDSWIENDANVLFEGLQGVGKTARILEAFRRNLGRRIVCPDGIERFFPGEIHKDFLYFSAPTLDVWVDLVGVPHVVKGRKPVKNLVAKSGRAAIKGAVEVPEELGEEVTYLGIVRPEFMVMAEPKAIFFDELNRASKKVRNAVMELIQFGSINGHKFAQLKCVWASINPDDDPNTTFDVEPLDPALRDRFHFQIGIPSVPDDGYFSDKYGPDMAKAAISWWKNLTDEVKLKVSPRRLDYAMALHSRGLNVRQMLPKDSNPTKLASMLKSGLPEEKFRKLIAEQNKQEMQKFLAKTNNFDAVQRFIISEPECRSFCLTLLDAERLTMLLSKHPKVKDEVLSHPAEHRELISELAKGAQNERLKNECEKLLGVIDQIEARKGVVADNFDSSLAIKPVLAKDDLSKWLRESFDILSEAPGVESYVDAKQNQIIQPYVGDVNEEIKKLAYFCQLECTNAYYLGQLIERVSHVVARQDLNDKQVVGCLKFCEFFASRSSDLKVITHSLFMLVFNSLVQKLRQHNAAMKSSDLFEMCPHVYMRYFGNNTINRKDSRNKQIFDNLIVRIKNGCAYPADPTLNVSI